jgi:hypothetical protein
MAFTGATLLLYNKIVILWDIDGLAAYIMGELGVLGRADEGKLHSFLTSAFFTPKPLYPCAKNSDSHCGHTDRHS